MPTETDMRLKSWLDANQRDREQMCRSVLALDPHYSDVRPRHPSGGPDGGRDIEAVFDGERVAYGAVGFQNGANDSNEQKKQIRTKFSCDLKLALAAKPDLKVFAFLTNLHFTIGEHDQMKEEARTAGIEHCDILDRERLRIDLDSPAGFFVRFQHLGLPLTEAEQASFLAHYGDRVQEVVSTGFQRVERTLNRILFLQESRDVLRAVYVWLRLKESYPAAEIGHFRAFVSMYLRAVKHGDISEIWFGSSDKSDRFRHNIVRDEPGGIAHGIGSGQWEKHVKLQTPVGNDHGMVPDLEQWEDDQDLFYVGSGSWVGMDPVPVIVIHYQDDDALIRFRPRLELRDLDDCMFKPVLNRSLAEKLHSIEVFANGYKLAYIGPDDFTIDGSRTGLPIGTTRMPRYDSTAPDRFTPEELADPWVQIRPSNLSSFFELSFLSTTPRRMFEHNEPPDTHRSSKPR
jgi:hypothetical protein